jgi:hypothetical protein
MTNLTTDDIAAATKANHAPNLPEDIAKAEAELKRTTARGRRLRRITIAHLLLLLLFVPSACFAIAAFTSAASTERAKVAWILLLAAIGVTVSG